MALPSSSPNRSRPGRFRIEARWQPGPRTPAYAELWRRILRDIAREEEPPR